MKKALIAFVCLALSSAVAMADVPDPNQCSVTPSDALNGVICCPNIPSALTESINTITVKNQNGNAIANASVVVLLTASNPTCPAAVLTATTNASGVATITIAASGCAKAVPSACVVKANGVTIRTYVNAKSPDYDGAGGNGSVGIADLVSFANEFNGITPPGCHDYTNDGATGIGDLVPFGSAFSAARHCP